MKLRCLNCDWAQDVSVFHAVAVAGIHKLGKGRGHNIYQEVDGEGE